MPRYVSDDDEPLEDKTAALTLKTKRTERMKRRHATKQQKRDAIVTLTKLPTELILECIEYLEPRDVFHLSFANRRLNRLVNANASVIGDAIIATRYSILAQCFPIPKQLSEVEPEIQTLLTDPNRQNQLSIHNRPFAHIQSPDPHQLCTCLTCILTWNNLNLILDFAHWQDSLDAGIPIPILPRGQTTEWNKELVERHARIVQGAVRSSLWHARILQLHLDSTRRAIQRHGANKGNKRIHVAMTDEDATSGTDSFLVKYGPPSLEFPYQRDEYYMLEAYLPNRWWRKVEARWIYTIAGQHDRDLELVQRLARRDQLALLTHAMACINMDTWMTDVMYFKTSMVSSQVERSVKRPLKHYVAVA